MPQRTWPRAASVITLVGILGACGGPDPGATLTPPSGSPAQASEEKNFRDFGDYVVHFNAIATDQISPDVAREYSITRSPNRAMLNVSILRKESNSPGRAVAGSVSARVVNLTGQLKSVEMRQITEGEAIYYIGEINVANGETLIFDISVTPLNETSRFDVRYQQQFYGQ